MEHKIEELDNCIFDYLSSHPDQPKSINEIYNSITGSTGHRCTELNNFEKKDIYKNKFITECYLLDTTFENIHKIFKNDKMFLIYSDKTKADIMSSLHQFYDTPLYELELNININIDDMINHVINNREFYYDFDLTSPITSTDNIIQYLIKTNREDQLKKILDLFYVDTSSKDSQGKSLIDLAYNNNNINIMKMLMEYDHNKKITDILIQNQNLKKYNTQYNKQNDILIKENIILKEQLNNTNKCKYLSNIVLFSLLTINIVAYLI